MGKLFFAAVAGVVAFGVAPLSVQATPERGVIAALSGRVDAALSALPAGATPAVALRAINAVIRGAEPDEALDALRESLRSDKHLSAVDRQALERAIEVATLELRIQRAIAALGPNPSTTAVAAAIDSADAGVPLGVVALALDDLSSTRLPGETPTVRAAIDVAFADARTALVNGSATGGIGGGGGGATGGAGASGGGASGGGGGSGYG